MFALEPREDLLEKSLCQCLDKPLLNTQSTGHPVYENKLKVRGACARDRDDLRRVYPQKVGVFVRQDYPP